MVKRGNNAGTVYESPKGSGRWFAQLHAGPDGKRPRRRAATKAEAEALLRQMHSEREAGRDLLKRVETVKELMDSYLEAVAGQQRPGTRQTSRLRAVHITNAIGSMRIDAVKLDTVQAMANKLVKKLSPEVVRATLQMLHSAYERVIPEQVTRNPVDWRRLRLRKGKAAERHPLEDHQVLTLLSAADADSPHYAIFVWLAALTGMRRAEIAGATWRDLNWERSELRVRKQIGLTEEGTYEPGQDLKTAESVRVLPIGPHLLARLRQHWNEQQALRKAHGWKEHGLIVCDEQGEPVRVLNLINDWLERLAKQIGLPHTHPHLLRHTFATIAGDEGTQERVIGALLGHIGRGTTQRYTHPTEQAKRTAILAVEGRIFGAEEAQKEAK